MDLYRVDGVRGRFFRGRRGVLVLRREGFEVFGLMFLEFFFGGFRWELGFLV